MQASVIQKQLPAYDDNRIKKEGSKRRASPPSGYAHRSVPVCPTCLPLRDKQNIHHSSPITTSAVRISRRTALNRAPASTRSAAANEAGSTTRRWRRG